MLPPQHPASLAPTHSTWTKQATPRRHVKYVILANNTWVRTRSAKTVVQARLARPTKDVRNVNRDNTKDRLGRRSAPLVVEVTSKHNTEGKNVSDVPLDITPLLTRTSSAHLLDREKKLLLKGGASHTHATIIILKNC
tara:strand:- start:463 stop:876 length:414 start_codon:yes stop_codon:yes gene_type:complete